LLAAAFVHFRLTSFIANFFLTSWTYQAAFENYYEWRPVLRPALKADHVSLTTVLLDNKQ
jgi:hypothetical protein